MNLDLAEEQKCEIEYYQSALDKKLDELAKLNANISSSDNPQEKIKRAQIPGVPKEIEILRKELEDSKRDKKESENKLIDSYQIIEKERKLAGLKNKNICLAIYFKQNLFFIYYCIKN